MNKCPATTDPLRVLTPEEAEGIAVLSPKEISAALSEGAEERDAIEAIAQQPQNIDPNVRFR